MGVGWQALEEGGGCKGGGGVSEEGNRVCPLSRSPLARSDVHIPGRPFCHWLVELWLYLAIHYWRRPGASAIQPVVLYQGLPEGMQAQPALLRSPDIDMDVWTVLLTNKLCVACSWAASASHGRRRSVPYRQTCSADIWPHLGGHSVHHHQLER
jgi:hypothetical protein